MSRAGGTRKAEQPQPRRSLLISSSVAPKTGPPEEVLEFGFPLRGHVSPSLGVGPSYAQHRHFGNWSGGIPRDVLEDNPRAAATARMISLRRLTSFGPTTRAPFIALAITLALAWVNFATTARWGTAEGALHGWRRPWYGAALAVATVLAFAHRRRVGQAIQPGALAPRLLLAASVAIVAPRELRRFPQSADTRGSGDHTGRACVSFLDACGGQIGAVRAAPAKASSAAA